MTEKLREQKLLFSQSFGYKIMGEARRNESISYVAKVWWNSVAFPMGMDELLQLTREG